MFQEAERIQVSSVSLSVFREVADMLCGKHARRFASIALQIPSWTGESASFPLSHFIEYLSQ